ncbi:DNRLRE domain-containing protein [Halomonas denitrificans]|nr:DNRLRE domain-containing protein [Halomonas denitrificans]
MFRSPGFRFSLRPFVRLALAAMVPFAASSVYGDTLTVAPDRDNTLYERAAGDLSNGAGPNLFFGRTGVNAGNVRRRALMRFDLSAIPPGSVVNSVELTLEVDLVPPGATGFDAALHRVLADWGEGGSVAQGAGGAGAPAVAPDATWLHREFDTVPWSSPGGDYAAAASSTAPVGSGTGPVTFVTAPGLVDDVQQWVDDPGQNFGWILIGEEGNPQNARRIGSRENAALTPQLVVDFEPLVLPEAEPVPAMRGWGMVLLVLAVAVLALRFRRS